MHLTVDVIWALKTQAQNSQNCFTWNFKKDVVLSLKIVTTTAQKVSKKCIFKQLLTDFSTYNSYILYVVVSRRSR